MRVIHRFLSATLTVGLVLAVGTVSAQTITPSAEGYDIMRQITSQLTKPTLLIVLDTSGSMAGDVNGQTVGVDGVGYIQWDVSTSSTGCARGTTKYRYTPHWYGASRMSTVKNALGDSVTINIYTKPATWPDPGNAYTYVGSDTWTTVCRNNNPGNPFDLNQYVASSPPMDLVGKNSTAINWGLETFESGSASCTKATLIMAPDTSDGSDVTLIESNLELNSAGGLGAGSYTPTRGALNFAKTVLQYTASGGTFTDYGNDSFTLPADPKIACGRIYGVILVTDGLSNGCNNGSTNKQNADNWGEPCCNSNWNNVVPCMSDTQVNDTCPADWANYPAGKSDELWNATATVAGTSYSLRARTFVIGVSPVVGPCELNHTAYKGRSDAGAQRADAGVGLVTAATGACNKAGVVPASCAAAAPLDCYLPGAAAATCTTTPQPGTIGGYDGPTTNSCTVHQGARGKDYAYFALSSDALARAINDIIGAFGAGDYTTSAPSVASGGASGTLGFIASADYPEWRGHLYAYYLTADCSNTTLWDCSVATPCGWFQTTGTTTKRSSCAWDAGEILTSGKLTTSGNTTNRMGANNALARKLFTWNPTDDSMVEITAGNLATINTICGCTLDGPTIDFIQGGIGAATGVTSRWQLGPLINSTPAVVGPPGNWKALTDHTTFQGIYQNRHKLLWVGSSDGFLHAFDVVDGAEVAAVIPPTMLPRQQQLYAKFLTNPTAYQTGQPSSSGAHVYGMANSLRVADVEVDNASPYYRTMLYATEGPGSDMGVSPWAGTNRGVFAIDVTHVYPGRDYNNDGTADTDPDPCYGFPTSGDCTAPDTTGDPARIVWHKTAADSGWSGLGQSWSVPAVASMAGSTWKIFMGGGWDPRMTTATVPKVFLLRADTGAQDNSSPFSLSNAASGAWVRNQSFADSVFWQRSAAQYNEWNSAEEGLQSDLQGHVFRMNPNSYTPSVLFNLVTDVTNGKPEPLYYPPAVAAFPYKDIADASAQQAYSLYAFESGTFYERSPNINGANTGNTGYFIPSLYIGVWDRTHSSKAVKQIQIKTLNDPRYSNGTKIGRRAQVSAPPMVFTSRVDADPFALFLVYDPDADSCTGRSYIVRVNFPVANLAGATTNVYDAGVGAASGFAVTGSGVVAAQSYVEGRDPASGSEGRAQFVTVPDLSIPAAPVSGAINWWRELQ
jgi:hypothetical protein